MAACEMEIVAAWQTEAVIIGESEILPYLVTAMANEDSTLPY